MVPLLTTMPIKKMKLLVMGAGYVGMALLKALKELDCSVYVTTTQQDKVETLKAFASNVVLITPNDNHSLNQLIAECDAMVVLIAPKNRASYQDTYLKTAQVISEALKGRPTPFYIVYTSSTSVYEGTSSEWATENLSLTPLSENGKILIETERLLLKHPESCVLRLGGIFGPGRELHKRALNFSGREFPGSGDDPTNHIHRDDIVEAILYCLKHRLTGIYNIVNDDHPLRKDLYSRLCKELSVAEPLWNGNNTQVKKGYKVSNSKFPHKTKISLLDHVGLNITR